MLKNYLTILFRKFRKERLYSLLNILGLTVGVTCFLLIYAFVQNEKSYDTFHTDAERILRVGYEVSLGTGTKVIVGSPERLARTLKEDFPNLEDVTHFTVPYEGEVWVGETKYVEEAIVFAEENFFQFYDFELLAGSKEEVLKGPGKVVITETMALNYFGSVEEALGKEIKVQSDFDPHDIPVVVSGVMEDMPANSHFHFDVLFSMDTGTPEFPQNLKENWGWTSCYTYVKLGENMSNESFNEDLIAFGEKHIEGKWFIEFFSQPMLDIHLYSHLNMDIETNGNAQNVAILSIIALIILVLAVVNYMNLSTARALNRAKEVGVRKSVGASRSQVAFQFFGEALVFTGIAVITGYGLAVSTLDSFGSLFGFVVSNVWLYDPAFISLLILGSLVVGVLSGSYPALYLSSFNPKAVLKGDTARLRGGALGVRKGLVVFQYTLSVALILGTLVVNNQLQFLRSKSLGADVENTLVVTSSVDIRENFQAFKNELLGHANIKQVTSSSKRFGADINSGNFFKVSTDKGLTDARLSIINVNPDFFNFYGIDVVAGKDFSEDLPTDRRFVILNQSALHALEINDYDQILGNTLKANGFDFQVEVIGVIDDIHLETIHNKIKPMFFLLNNDPQFWTSVKVSGNTSDAITALESSWKKFEPRRTLNYSFLDEDLHQLYLQEEQFLSAFSFFSGVAIFVACLGLFGLSIFNAERRLKEIGMRKVLGASIAQIVMIFYKDFSKLILLAFVIGAPLAYWVMTDWLNSFEYHISPGIETLILTGVAAITVAFVTISYQSIKVSLVNPLKYLKEE
ncbi:MAG: ABC transporter permease [Bacteroidota bacterium]